MNTVRNIAWTIVAVILAIVLVIGGIKLWQWQPAAVAQPDAVVNLNPAGNGEGEEEIEYNPQPAKVVVRKPVTKLGGACTWAQIADGPFSTNLAVIIVKEVDGRGEAPVVFYHIQEIDLSITLNFGKDAVIAGADRYGWVGQGCSLEEANRKAYEMALLDQTAWLQLECVSTQLPAAQAEQLKVWDLGGGNWFIRVIPALDQKYFQVCEGGAPMAPAEPAAPAQPAAPAAGGTCDTSIARGSPVYPGEIVPAGTVVVYEVVDYVAHKITVQGLVLTTNTKAGATMQNANIHINMWIGFCYVSDASFDAAGQAEERRMDALKSGSWNEGWTDITFIR